MRAVDDLRRYGATIGGSDPEEELWGQLRSLSLSADPIEMPQRQFLFAKSLGRKWAADFCWPEGDLIVEVDGGSWVAGRHTRGAGFEADRERDAEALCMGYRVLRVTPKQIKDGKALAWIERLLK